MGGESGVWLPIAWIALGVVLIAVELHHLAFYALFAAVGAFAAAVVALAAPDALAAQAAVAVVVAAAGIVLLRGRVSEAVAHRQGGHHRVPGVHGGLVGQEVVTLDQVGEGDRIGHVQLAGERWRAVSGGDHAIPPGTPVLVTAVQGTTLIVWPVDGQVPPPAVEEPEQETEQP
jgi:membrane protein implicated in regulation of membrane protease activity